jgi:hypothetical protein
VNRNQRLVEGERSAAAEGTGVIRLDAGGNTGFLSASRRPQPVASLFGQFLKKDFLKKRLDVSYRF